MLLRDNFLPARNNIKIPITRDQVQVIKRKKFKFNISNNYLKINTKGFIKDKIFSNSRMFDSALSFDGREVKSAVT